MNLWNEGALFPTVSLSYTFSPRHILQFDISSDKTIRLLASLPASNASKLLLGGGGKSLVETLSHV